MHASDSPQATIPPLPYITKILLLAIMKEELSGLAVRADTSVECLRIEKKRRESNFDYASLFYLIRLCHTIASMFVFIYEQLFKLKYDPDF